MFFFPVPECPQLSSPLSTGEHNHGYVDLGPDCYRHLCVEPLDGEHERPVSLVSTLSSGSSRDSHSLFGITVALPSSTTPPIPSEEDIDLELSPTGGTEEKAGDQSASPTESRGLWQERLKPSVISNNNKATSNRKASGEIPHVPTSPVVTDAMAPNPKLTYVDRVVMEIIETERMYVKDLRSIVEVSGCQVYASCTQMKFSITVGIFHFQRSIRCEPTVDIIVSKSPLFCVFEAFVWLGLMCSYDLMSAVLFGFGQSGAEIGGLGLMAAESK